MKVSQETLIHLMSCFRNSFINHNFEFICCTKTNSYFRLEDVESELELKCKVLEWLSRNAAKTEYCHSERHNRIMQEWHLNGINKFLGTNFTREQMENIYTYLGNGINRDLCIKFIESNYDMKVLEGI
jgi:hypothetical protein